MLVSLAAGAPPDSAPGAADLVVRVVDAAAPPDDLPAQAVADAAAASRAVVVYLAEGASRVAVVALGEEEGAERYRLAAARAAAAALELKAARVALVAPDGFHDGADQDAEQDADEALAALVEGFLLGAYRFTRYRTVETEAWGGPEALAVHAPEARRAAVEAAAVRAEATALARDLVNLSPDEKTPALFAERVAEAARAAGVRADVWDKARITDAGMGGLLAVNRGSQDPPAFVVLEHRPAGARNARPVVLVGKAVVFDTGGLSLKPTAGSMDSMKADMAGGAAVAAAVVGAARLGLPLHVVGLIPATDNRPGERAYVPGDVVRMLGGTTVEVLNTDAEGRLILADALTYAQGLAPELVVDVATLTGAQVIALGSRVAALLTTDDAHSLARRAAFELAGRRTGDLVAPLPLYGFFRDQLKSEVADLKNIGGREAGTITAAKFLEHFTRTPDGEAAYPWVHLDIAGPAFLEKGYGYRPAGGSGFGVRLLLDVLEHYDALRAALAPGDESQDAVA